jgi:hypothetical protein
VSRSTVLYTYEGYEKLGSVVSHSYGDFSRYEREVSEDLRKSLYIRPPEMSGSDYSGGLSTLSNYKAFLKMFKDTEGVLNLWGGYGTYAIAIRLDVSEDNTEVKDILELLNSYPLIDENLYNEIEDEWQDEALKHIVDDLIRDINLEEYIPNYEELLEDKDKIKEMACGFINNNDLEWSLETKSAYLDYKKVQPYIEDVLILKHCKNEILPLLINRGWACEENKESYTKRMSNDNLEDI